MLKTIPLHNGKTLCAVKVPEDFDSAIIEDNQLTYWVEGQHGSRRLCDFRSGNWRILALANELNDEQKKEVCEKWENTEYYQAFGTDLHVGYNLSRAYELFLAANKLYSENPLPYPRFHPEDNLELHGWNLSKWNEAQQHVGRWLLLIKD